MIGRRALASRARLLSDVRRFFDRRGFTEVDPPIRIRAPAPERFVEPVPAHGGFLRTSPELQMKRLLAEGHRRIYCLGPVFRGGERGERHAEEFTMLEWYRARADFRALERDCEALLRSVARRKSIRVRGARVHLDRPFERRSVVDALAAVGVDARTASDEAWSEAMGLHVEPTLGIGLPTFLEAYPLRQGALARRSETDPTLVDRFELYVAGRELANGFSELNDPDEQRARFEAQLRARQGGDDEAHAMDEDYVRALEHGMPPAAGEGIGVDRLVMLLTDAPSIRDVILFPQLRPERR